MSDCKHCGGWGYILLPTEGADRWHKRQICNCKDDGTEWEYYENSEWKKYIRR